MATTEKSAELYRIFLESQQQIKRAEAALEALKKAHDRIARRASGSLKSLPREERLRYRTIALGPLEELLDEQRDLLANLRKDSDIAWDNYEQEHLR